MIIKRERMSINITDKAREKIIDVMKDSELTNPALRLVFNGFG
jgi:Fe-S cluster assembly iron-binding protein IscA